MDQYAAGWCQPLSAIAVHERTLVSHDSPFGTATGKIAPFGSLQFRMKDLW